MAVFFTYLALVLIAAVPAAAAHMHKPADGPRNRYIRAALWAAASASLAALLIKAIFGIFPAFEARLMPIDGYVHVQREFYLPFTVFFFAAASRILPEKRRVFALVLAAFFTLFTAYQLSWRLSRPAAYDLPGRVDENGVFRQSSWYTCVPASMGTLLNRMGVETTEGEMAELSGTVPGLGTSHHQAAWGLTKKLESVGRPERARLVVPADKKLDSLKPPFLAGYMDGPLVLHMVCVLEIDRNFVTMGDPVQGVIVMNRDYFEFVWLGVAVVVSAGRN